MNKLYIVMPAYNEEINIEKVINEWYPILEGKDDESRLVIADSGSNDRTHEIIASLKIKLPKIEILENTLKEHGAKLIALYDYSLKNNADYIFQTDSDGQTNPAEFASFWKDRDTYDVILGNRIVRGDGKSRKFVENVVCFMLYIFFGVKVPDANAPFRLMRASIVKKYLYKLPSEFNIPNIMLTAYFTYYKEKVKFIEISFKSRSGGDKLD